MAVTTRPIVWEFYKKIENANEMGGLVHYFDTTAQKLYLNNGVRTRTTTVQNGHWKDTIYGEEIVLNQDNYDSISIDQTTSNEFHMTGKIGNSLYFMRYNGKVLLNTQDYLNQLT